MKPLLAHVYEPPRVSYPCYVQPKLNGIRALYQNGQFQSRDELPFPSGLLDHLSEPLRQIFPDPSVILDGELYKHGWPLQRINGAVTPIRQEPNEDTLQVEYHVFDRVQFGSSFRERSPYWGEFVGSRESHIRIITTTEVKSEAEANKIYARYVDLGYEGMMYRLGDCPYTVPKQLNNSQRQLADAACGTNQRTKFLSDKDNRCWHLLKRKDWQDDEFECLGVVEGEGKLQGMLGAVVCAIDEGQEPNKGHSYLTFNVGSGLTDSERQHYWANPPIGRKIKVKYLVLSNDGIPLNPTILCIL